jgi:phage terminase small subunit
MITPIVDDNLRTDRQAAFVREYVKDWNATQAAIRAGYSERTADEQGSRLLANPRVRSAIARRLEQIAAIAEVDTAMVVRELLDVATADVRELVSVYRDCCRHCYGIGHEYEWDEREFRKACEAAAAHLCNYEKPKDGGCFNPGEKCAKRIPPFPAGGFGFTPRRPPVDDCPECFGRGVESVVLADSRQLSPQAAKLYAGAQQTKDGIKALVRNQNEALLALGRYLGMFKDRSEVSGPGGGPVPIASVSATVNLNELTDVQLLFIATRGGTIGDILDIDAGKLLEVKQLEACSNP